MGVEDFLDFARKGRKAIRNRSTSVLPSSRRASSGRPIRSIDIAANPERKDTVANAPRHPA
jgi:hypothetical protein